MLSRLRIRSRFKALSAQPLILAILLAVILCLAVLLLWDIRVLRRDDAFKIKREEMRAFLDGRKSRKALTEKDLDYIRPWMTFDYVNRLFFIPPDYLKNILHISDGSYPNLVLEKEAKKNGIHPVIYAQQVKNAIRAYAASLIK